MAKFAHPVLHQQIFDNDFGDDVLHLCGKGVRTEVGQVSQCHNGGDVVGRLWIQGLLNMLSTHTYAHKTMHANSFICNRFAAAFLRAYH